MEIVVDGIAYEKLTMRGVSRIFTETLPRMCDMSKDVRFALLTTNISRHPLVLPSHPQIKHVSRFGAQRFFQGRWLAKVKNDVRRQIFRNLSLQTPALAIWHSTYYTLPYQWQGYNVLTVPDMIYELFPQLFNHPLDEPFRVQKQRCIEEADIIICISQSTADDLHAYYHFTRNKPTYVVPLACNDVFRRLSDIENRYSPPTEKKFILYVGSRYHYKNFDQFLRAYSAWELNSEVDLVVVGGNWNKTERILINNLRLEESIHLLTSVEDDELNYLYNVALFFVYPSLYEGFGLPLLEAMRCGCPIVASKIPSTVEVAGNSPTYFEPNNLDAFVDALTTAAKLGRDSHQVQLGLKRSLDYSWEKSARITLDIYSSFFV